MNNVVLIGMPGAGKSSVGVVLAKMMNFGFIDADLVIQQKYNRTLQELINTEGPEGFIMLENGALSSIEAKNTVIATGGSAVYSEEGMSYLASRGRVVYLQISFEEMQMRLGDLDKRGVVFRQGIDFDLRSLYAEREPLYRRHADIVVDVSDLSIREAANRIYQRLS